MSITSIEEFKLKKSKEGLIKEEYESLNNTIECINSLIDIDFKFLKGEYKELYLVILKTISHWITFVNQQEDSFWITSLNFHTDAAYRLDHYRLAYFEFNTLNTLGSKGLMINPFITLRVLKKRGFSRNVIHTSQSLFHHLNLYIKEFGHVPTKQIQLPIFLYQNLIEYFTISFIREKKGILSMLFNIPEKSWVISVHFDYNTLNQQLLNYYQKA